MTRDHPLAIWIDKRMSRDEFARQVGISKGHLSMVLQRKRGLSLDLAIRIENATIGDLTAAALLGATKVPEAAE